MFVCIIDASDLTQRLPIHRRQNGWQKICADQVGKRTLRSFRGAAASAISQTPPGERKMAIARRGRKA
jgi:hypothetical protein